jgi:hypothetical protein
MKIFLCFRVKAGCRKPRLQLWFYQTTSNILKMGTKSVPEMLGNLHIATSCLAEEISLNSVATIASGLKSFCSYTVDIKTKRCSNEW